MLFNDPKPGSAQIVFPKDMDAATFNLVQNVLFPFMPVSRGTNLSYSLVDNAYLNFAPRLGLAWRIS